MDSPDPHALQAIADRLEIEDLLTRYATAVDRKDWNLYRTVFTPDATIDYESAGGIAGSVDEVAEWLAETMPMFDAGQHLITNVELMVTGDSATVRAAFFNPMSFKGVDGPAGRFQCGGWYNHDLVRTPEGWRSARLVEDMDWTTLGEA